MSLHPLHEANHGRVFEIGEDMYFHLMHDLTMAGASEPVSYGSGWVATHPVLGRIAVSRVKRPARHRRHPPLAFFVESFSDEGVAKVKAKLPRL